MDVHAEERTALGHPRALPAGCDLYLLKNVLADWPDREAIALLKRCAEAAAPSGRVVVQPGVTNLGITAAVAARST